MRITVDPDICQRHGQCEFFAPAVFRLTEEMELEYVQEPGDGEREAVEEASRGCPTQAITIDDAE